ncbi:MAG: pyridoxamine 5'-phosphate oxidase family protein [Leptospiraceae bacterium]|nr:pyridoxamine 5'-phosphate oxidase family protein [Leptospiraceae bacterium]MCP5493986.1 pyridoxamine 5'-phosphate oxidase family protein [Leptospiraceae bacterium]
MRRNEFESNDKNKLEIFLKETKIGYLNILTPDGFPRSIPLNFVYSNDSIFFHGALDGEKFLQIQNLSPVTFHANRPYSMIPSYWVAKDYACPATTFFRSADLHGNIEILSDEEQKATILQMFMEKYQPEGGYKPIRLEDSLYRKSILETAVCCMTIERFSLKEKFGQNKSVEFRKKLIDLLKERNHGDDLLAAKEIEETF